MGLLLIVDFGDWLVDVNFLFLGVMIIFLVVCGWRMLFKCFINDFDFLCCGVFEVKWGLLYLFL